MPEAILGVAEAPATIPCPGRSTASLVRDCLFVQRAGLVHSEPSVSGGTWCLTSTETTRLIRDGEKEVGGGGRGKEVRRWGKGQIISLSPNCHHKNDSCIKMGNNESHSNVPLTVRNKVTRQCPQTTTLTRKESRSGMAP